MKFSVERELGLAGTRIASELPHHLNMWGILTCADAGITVLNRPTLRGKKSVTSFAHLFTAEFFVWQKRFLMHFCPEGPKKLSKYLLYSALQTTLKQWMGYISPQQLPDDR